MLRGNPRGSESTELDPGFRHRVLRLQQDQSNKTVDASYTVPRGTAIKVRIVCQKQNQSCLAYWPLTTPSTLRVASMMTHLSKLVLNQVSGKKFHLYQIIIPTIAYLLLHL